MYKIKYLVSLKNTDSEVYQSIMDEMNRLNNSIELIASENVVSPSVLEAAGSIMTNKYAEGYPSKRYYGGCVHVDVVEDLAKSRLSKLFKCEENGYKVNVQPHSGSQANMAAYMSVLNPGDVVLGMDLSSGGHLTHGSSVNFSGKLYNFISYGTDNKGYIDYDDLREVALKEKPKMIVAGASAYPRRIDFEKLGAIAKDCGSYLLVDIAHIAGLVATGNHPSPIPHADFVTSTTHKTLRGTRGGIIMCKEEFAKKVDSAVFPGMQGGPLMHIIAAKAVAFKDALSDDFKEYQSQVIKNANIMAETLIQNGIDIVSGGTDNHLMLLDLTKLDMTGKVGEHILEEAGITTNKNGIPNDPQPPWITTGIRIGTPAMTTRGFKEEEAKKVGELIAKVLKNKDDASILDEVRAEVKVLCDKFPLYELEN